MSDAEQAGAVFGRRPLGGVDDLAQVGGGLFGAALGERRVDAEHLDERDADEPVLGVETARLDAVPDRRREERLELVVGHGDRRLMRRHGGWRERAGEHVPGLGTSDAPSGEQCGGRWC